MRKNFTVKIFKVIIFEKKYICRFARLMHEKLNFQG